MGGRGSQGRRGRWAAGLLVAGLLLVAQVSRLSAAPKPPWRFTLPPGRAHASITVGGVPLDVELSLTEPERELGLGYRDGLKPGTGMLFVYEGPGVRTFWMKGMRFCLDIVWIEGGEIAGAAEGVCPSPAGTPAEALPRFSSPQPVTYVLEVPAGWLADHGLGAGSPVTIPPLPGTPDAG